MQSGDYAGGRRHNLRLPGIYWRLILFYGKYVPVSNSDSDGPFRLKSCDMEILLASFLYQRIYVFLYL